MMDNELSQQELDEHPLTQYLDFSYSSFGKPNIDVVGGIIVVPVREFKVYPGFPGYDKSVIVLDGDLIFEDVASSIREIAEHETAYKTTYRDSYKINDGAFPKPKGTLYEFYLGGFTYDPSGWVEWYLDIVSVKVRERSSKLADPQ